jgi:hypothetical protein
MGSLEDLKNAVGNLDEDEAGKILDGLLAAGSADAGKVLAACQEGMGIAEGYCALIGADAWSLNAAECVGICKKWLA